MNPSGNASLEQAFEGLSLNNNTMDPWDPRLVNIASFTNTKKSFKQDFFNEVVDAYVKNPYGDAKDPYKNINSRRVLEKAFKGYFSNVLIKDASDKFLNTAFNVACLETKLAESKANRYTKMKTPLEPVLLECSLQYQQDAFLEAIKYFYVNPKEIIHKRVDKKNMPIFELQETPDLDEYATSKTHVDAKRPYLPHPQQGDLAEGLVVAHLNSSGFKCPECEQTSCFAPIANDLEGVHSNAWKDCLCVSCYEAQNQLTLFEIKTKGKKVVKDGLFRRFKVNGGNFAALNVLLKAGAKVYVVVNIRQGKGLAGLAFTL